LDDGKIGGRRLRQKVLGLLKVGDPETSLRELSRSEPRAVVNALISLFYSPEEIIRWRAITAAGAVVTILAEKDREGARVIVRRLLWSLNDESGGIGWGAPEALAEIMARDELLAEEYSRIFVSYLDEKGNFLEHEGLQQGLLWGLARLAGVRPDLIKEAVPHLGRYLESGNAAVRGLAARAAGLLGAQELRPRVRTLLKDEAALVLFEKGRMITCRVSDMARETLAALDMLTDPARARKREAPGP